MNTRRRTLATRLAEKVRYEPANGCWIFTGCLDRGYGRIKSGDGRRVVQAHRAMYELHRAPIPEGLQIDHLCRVPACVNPDHLEPVTAQENIGRGESPKMASRRNSEKAICDHGHDLTDMANVRIGRDGRRICRSCARRRTKAYEDRKNRGESCDKTTQCKRGHSLLDPTNVHIRSDGARHCRACCRLRAKKYRQQRHEKGVTT